MENIFSCKRCGYETKLLANLKTHFRRKKSCKDILNCRIEILDLLNDINSELDFECDICADRFKTKQGLVQHNNICKILEFDKLKKENEILNEEIHKLKLQNNTTINNNNTTNNNTINNNNTTNNNNTNITLIINDFGNESISHIVDDKQFLEKCMKELFTSAIENVVKKIYFDKEHPENNNIKMQNIKLNQVMIRKDGDWERTNISGPAIKMIRKSRNILQNHYISSGDSQKEIDRMIEEESIEPDRKMNFLNKVVLPDSNEHKSAISKVKGVISNYKFTT